MIDSRRLKTARIFVIILLVLLVVQYEMGVLVTLSDPPQIPPFGFSSAQFNEALTHLNLAGNIHADLGPFLGLFALVAMIFSLRARIRSAQLAGVLAFLATAIAGVFGQLFAQSGFSNDNYTHGMAIFFILSLIFYFLELYFLKPVRGGRMET